MGSLERSISFFFDNTQKIFRTIYWTAKFDLGFSWAMFCRVLFLLLLLIFCSSGAEVVTVDVHTTKDLINSGHKYLDVRTVEEYKKGHVGADKILNIPYMFNTPEGRVKNPLFLSEVSSACNKEDQLIVGCQSGVRSLSATADLLSAVSLMKIKLIVYIFQLLAGQISCLINKKAT
ncbi:hypothetical protein SO802_025141 [Lithocarpus litseifolius]|uniref:Rhodanese domain-containing protein n=1 Tax=Lithocarpus litseifolius TaxID=425828 RepID=A0AAW2BWA4_9ROSI